VKLLSPESGPPAAQPYDLVVIGSGPGGRRAAIQAAKLQKRVLLIERDLIGGHCLHRGTIPSKTLREAALANGDVGGGTLQMIMERKRAVISGETDVIEQQIDRNGVELVGGRGSLVSAHEVAIDTPAGRSIVRGEYVIIATGTSPSHPAGIDFDAATVFDSDTVLNIDRVPRTLAVIGAGVIGCEYASIFARMGSRVTLVNKHPGILRGVDDEITEALKQHFSENRIQLRLATEFSGIAPVTKADGSRGARVVLKGKEHIFDAVLYCVGREGNVEQLNLAAAGLAPDARGLIAVDEHYRTSVPNIYAVGDVVGFPSLAASSAEQGRLAAAHAFGLSEATLSKSFPYGIYTIPEISWAGKLEAELVKEGVRYVVGRARYRELARGRILGDVHGFLKLLVQEGSGKILGVHVLGTGATELVHIGQVAMDLGAGVEFLVSNVFNYPTLAEAYKVAAYQAYNQLNASGARELRAVPKPG